MLKVAEREQVKLEAIVVERRVFEQRCLMREVKRKLGEAEGDEDLLVSRREKRRKREDGSVAYVFSPLFRKSQTRRLC
jgi:enhancer of polycomb-like protein